MKRRSCFGLLALMGAATFAVTANGSAELWRLLRGGGHVILMRHANRRTVPEKRHSGCHRIDSMFRDQTDAKQRKQRKQRDVRAYLGSVSGAGNLVMVTHGVDIQALVGRSMRAGEMVVAGVEANGAVLEPCLWTAAVGLQHAVTAHKAILPTNAV